MRPHLNPSAERIPGSFLQHFGHARKHLLTQEPAILTFFTYAPCHSYFRARSYSDVDKDSTIGDSLQIERLRRLGATPLRYIRLSLDSGIETIALMLANTLRQVQHILSPTMGILDHNMRFRAWSMSHCILIGLVAIFYSNHKKLKDEGRKKKEKGRRKATDGCNGCNGGNGFNG